MACITSGMGLGLERLNGYNNADSRLQLEIEYYDEHMKREKAAKLEEKKKVRREKKRERVVRNIIRTLEDVDTPCMFLFEEEKTVLGDKFCRN